MFGIISLAVPAILFMVIALMQLKDHKMVHFFLLMACALASLAYGITLIADYVGHRGA